MKNTIIYRMKSRLITLLLLLITVSSVTFAQEAKKEIPLKYGATNEGKRQDPAMQKFRDNRLVPSSTGDCMLSPGESGMEKYMAELPNG